VFGRRTVFLVIATVLPLLTATAFSPFSDNLRQAFSSTAEPFLAFGETVRAAFLDGTLRVKKFFLLYQENEKLKEELTLLTEEVLHLREAERENSRLQALLDLREEKHHRSVACRIVARELAGPNHWMLLNKGTRDGVVKEMAVVHVEGLVGKVVEVSADTAKAVVLTDLESRVSGLIQDSRDTGLVMGDGSPTLRMRFIDLSAEAKVGHLVLSSGLGGVFPKGVPIGQIEYLAREKRGLHLYARLKPSVSLSKVEEVLCLG
jgi:rod shape-determining protein MreC